MSGDIYAESYDTYESSLIGKESLEWSNKLTFSAPKSGLWLKSKIYSSEMLWMPRIELIICMDSWFFFIMIYFN